MIRNAESGSWRRMSQFHLLTDDEIVSALNDNSNVIRAVSFDRTTKYAAIELPNHSPYLEIDSFRKLVELLQSLGLKPRIYTASGSKDVQLFLFFSQAYKSTIVQDSLAKVLSWNGFLLRADKLVVYPSDVALPLPLQRGFAWLNEDLQPIVSRMEIALDSALALFCSEASRYATEFERVLDGANLLPTADLTAAEFWGLNPTAIESQPVDFSRAAVVDLSTTHITETGLFTEISSQVAEPNNVTEFPVVHAAETSTVVELPINDQFVRESMNFDIVVDSDESEDLDEILEPGSAFSFACAVPADKPEKTESLKAFPLWLVEEELAVEVFPVPAEQEVLEDMLVEDPPEELEQVVSQGQTNADDMWPRQSSQLLLVTNEPSSDVQLDLFSARKNQSKVDQQTPRPRRKRPRLEDTQKPEE
ncbi:MAG: hypothetical protein JST89_18880 [Cyanobacteria bacterium SZAS-4]|nr:hypothetical protein [Cyanobacteria bacterium SZAS-4]